MSRLKDQSHVKAPKPGALKEERKAPRFSQLVHDPNQVVSERVAEHEADLADQSEPTE